MDGFSNIVKVAENVPKGAGVVVVVVVVVSSIKNGKRAPSKSPMIDVGTTATNDGGGGPGFFFGESSLAFTFVFTRKTVVARSRNRSNMILSLKRKEE